MRLDLSGLASFRGSLITPYDPGYEGARVLFNTRVRTRPALLAQCADADDVAATIRFAREHELPLSVRGGGHHASGLSLVENGVVVDVGGMRSIDFDPAAGTVTVGPGVGWRDIDRVTYVEHSFTGPDGLEYGLAGPGGECPTVSNAGYSLGGGYGPLGRTYGLGCDHLVEVSVVDADGRLLRASETEHPDLFWALRGAGGAGLGVVTSLTYRLNPLPKTVVGGIAAWPLDRALDVFRAYRDLYQDRADDRLALCLLLTTEPYPEGEPVVAVYGMYVGPPKEAEEALAPIQGLGEPMFTSFGEVSYFDLMQGMGEEIVYGLQSKWLGGYFAPDGFDEPAFAKLVDHFRRSPSGFSMVRFDLLAGGAIARVPADATAFAHRDSLHYVSIIAQWQGDEETDLNVSWVDDFAEDLRPHLTGEVYQNYADRDLTGWETAYYGANYPRLQQVKAAYDPQDVFHTPQSIRLP
ncbi:FAD-binding oxidoreductase [Dactylosporangium sp. AC04546]|uniref:FAD-binding oxidoreductase n=1 Tax=Dactylosporangium sp. AC04546 TaxID=2862460 RepID=UPI001EDE452D|nr:FAD-binding oxidoreductase [Dactylosporangium sp. AC04546]WVK86208.1 FAD-binding oxidoreductase [Dactylosporangium sp. AC04546]